MKLLSLPNRPAPLKPIVFSDDADRAEFFSYFAANPSAGDDVRELHDAMLRISSAPTPHAGAKAAAQRGRPGWSWQYLQRLHSEWQAAGRDWRWLVNERDFPQARGPKYAPETEAWLRGELLRPQRTFEKGITAIHAQWRSWWRTGDARFAIPGMVDADGQPKCPAPDAGYLPRVLQKHHLRRVRIDPAVVEIIRYGTHAARALLPHIPGTREGVRPLEYVSADDVKLDVLTYVRGHGDCEVLQFGFWDLACSYYLPEAVGMRPVLTADDGTRRKLTRRDFLFNAAIFLETYGWPAEYPMHLLLENGTATMSAAEARFVETVTEGRVKIGYSSMEGEFVMGYEERRSGRSTAKAGHEGFHGILKNAMSHLRGQTGKDPEHRPAALHGRVNALRALDNALVQMPAEAAARAITPLLTMDQVRREVRAALDAIHGNPDHECELFETVIEWRPRGLHVEPQPMERLGTFLEQQRVNPQDREAVRRVVEFFDRRESRAERWTRMTRGVEFIRPPAGALVPLYEDHCELRAIGKDYSFEFQRDGKKHRFIPPTPDHRLPVGEKVCGFWRPDGQVIHLFSGADGKNRRHLVTWPSEAKLLRSADAATRAEFFNRKSSFFRAAKIEADAATAGQWAEARTEAAHNEALLREQGVLTTGDEAAGPNATTRAVQAVTQARTEHARGVQEARKIDLVKETLKRRPRERADTAAKWA